MSGVATKAAPELAKYRKYAHHLTTESTWTTAAREAKYMCVSPEPIACHVSHCTVISLPWTKGCYLSSRWPFLVGFVATGGIFLNIALGITGTVKLWSGALSLKTFFYAGAKPCVLGWYQMRT